MSDRPPRWDPDPVGIGIADAAGQVPALDRLREVCTEPGWVAEDADVHLGPHLRKACEGSPWRWVGAGQGDDGVYVVDVEGEGTYPDAVALLAVIAEHSFAVRKVDALTVECVTGTLAGDGPFAGHGHVVRLRIRRPEEAS